MYPQAPGFFHCSTVSGARSWNINPLFPDPSLKGYWRNLMEMMWKNHNGVSTMGRKRWKFTQQTHPMLWQPPKIARALPNSHGSSRFTTACRCHDDGDTIGGNGCQDLLRVTAKGRICISWCPFNGSCVGILMDLDDLNALFVCFFKSMKPKATENKKHFQNVSF